MIRALLFIRHQTEVFVLILQGLPIRYRFSLIYLNLLIVRIEDIVQHARKLFVNYKCMYLLGAICVMFRDPFISGQKFLVFPFVFHELVEFFRCFKIDYASKFFFDIRLLRTLINVQKKLHTVGSRERIEVPANKHLL